MKKLFFILLPGLVFAAVSCENGQEQPAKTDTQPSAKVNAPAGGAGESVFQQKCVVCHGDDGRKGLMGAADLSTSTINHEAAASIIANGKNSMKAFGAELTKEEIDAVATYVLTLRK